MTVHQTKLGRSSSTQGRTLYLFEKDTKGKSACVGRLCDVLAAAAHEGKPLATAGASKLGTTKRSDGTLQVTYAGHPLYTFMRDAKPGHGG